MEGQDFEVQKDLRLWLREVIRQRPLEACTTDAIFCKGINYSGQDRNGSWLLC